MDNFVGALMKVRFAPSTTTSQANVVVATSSTPPMADDFAFGHSNMILPNAHVLVAFKILD
jgi:hypothetical protein